jgi:hypothetical protein
MALLDLIKHRKSVRDFLDRPVEREKIMMCLEAARLATTRDNPGKCQLFDMLPNILRFL